MEQDRMEQLKQSTFDYTRYGDVIQYGDFFDGMWGYTTVTITKDQIFELLKGNVFVCEIAGEYSMLMRLELDEIELQDGDESDT